jgi:hypothetical protein
MTGEDLRAVRAEHPGWVIERATSGRLVAQRREPPHVRVDGEDSVDLSDSIARWEGLNDPPGQD